MAEHQNCEKANRIKELIRTIPDYPCKGIMFRDVSTLLASAEGLQLVADLFYEKYKDAQIQKIVGIEARGFVLGALLAYKLNIGFVMVRKAGKLPVGNGVEVIQESYEMEYRDKTTIEMHKDALVKDEKVLIIDDLLATGGTAAACAALVERLGAVVVECAFIVELPDLHGRQKLKYPMHTLVAFEGD
ncbi:hypothetical protein ABK040_008727 [Willaertia magna]